MTLFNCRDCDREVSDHAPACPNCGRPTKDPAPAPLGSTTSRAGMALLGCGMVFFVCCVITLMVDSQSRRPPIQLTPPPAETPEHAAARQKAADEAAAVRAAEEKKFLATKAGKVWKKHPDWSREICQAIADRKVAIGMNADQVIASWGRPNDINPTIFAGHRNEQWVYDRGNFDHQYVYLEDGIVTTIQG